MSRSNEANVRVWLLEQLVVAITGQCLTVAVSLQSTVQVCDRQWSGCDRPWERRSWNSRGSAIADIRRGVRSLSGHRRDIIWGHTRVTSVTKQDQVAAVKVSIIADMDANMIRCRASFRVTLLSHLSGQAGEPRWSSGNHKVLLNSNSSSAQWGNI